MPFTACQGKTACRDDGFRCLTCGRTLEEIERLRELLSQLANLALERGYDNAQDYAGYIARKLPRIIEHRKSVTTAD